MTTTHQSNQTDAVPDVGHIVSFESLLVIIVCLLLLTGLTVVSAGIGLGGAAVWLALGIAFTKATLVVLYFMHLRYDAPFYGLAFMSAFAFLAFFLFLVLMDTQEYQPNVAAFRNDVQMVAPGTP